MGNKLPTAQLNISMPTITQTTMDCDPSWIYINVSGLDSEPVHSSELLCSVDPKPNIQVDFPLWSDPEPVIQVPCSFVLVGTDAETEVPHLRKPTLMLNTLQSSLVIHASLGYRELEHEHLGSDTVFMPGEKIIPVKLGKGNRLDTVFMPGERIISFKLRKESRLTTKRSIIDDLLLRAYVPQASIKDTTEDGGKPTLEEVEAASLKPPDQVASLFEQVLLKTKRYYDLLREKEKIKKENATLRDKTRCLLHQIPEVKPFHGNTLWKISTVHQKMVDAQTGEQAVIYGEPFYMENLHYYAALQMHPNGEGDGQGTHVSLSLVIKKGAFDEYLKWPFTHKVTFRLINLVGEGDIVHTFQPDPIQKPEADDESFACGCQCFISHADLEEGGFVYDDTLFILCEVN